MEIPSKKTFIDAITKKMNGIEPTHLSLVKFLFQEKPINVYNCLRNWDFINGCTGITIKYKTLVDFYELLQHVSDYHEINSSNIPLFMITDETKVRTFCMQSKCL